MADALNPALDPRSDPDFEVVREKPRVGRPRKRRRVERKVRVCPGTENEETLAINPSLNLNTNVDLNEGFAGNLKENEGIDGNLSETLDEKGIGSMRDLNLTRNGDIEMKNGFDLNSSGFDLNLNDTYCSNNYLDDNGISCGGGENVKKRGCIDLNLDASCNLDDNINLNGKIHRKECGFDLNLGADEEVDKDAIDGNCGWQVEGRESTTCAEIPKEAQIMEINDVPEVVSTKELKKDHSDFGLVEGILEKGAVVDLDVIKADGCGGVGLEGVPESGTAVIDGSRVDIASAFKQATGRRKRIKVGMDLDSSTERVLRRSARRGSSRNHVSSSPPPPPATKCAVSSLATSPSVSAVTEEKPIRSGRKVSEEPVLLPKLQLPPSSKNLNLDGISVLDIFSIYACLRSFSTLLFLSPFELEDFVAALKCQTPSTLFDCIQVSILQALKKHLEYLSNEGSESASECLRSLNWGFLDCITWPIFLVEYLLIHGSGSDYGFDLTSLKLFRGDYYKLPASVKVEILRCLCDDLVEVEAVRSELNRRSLASETDMDFDRNMNNGVCKKRKAAMDISGGSGLSEDIIDDTNDWNSDDCCLCKMDGSLICCDGCPAAYHSKCVGVVNALLPEGDWYCPECAIEREKPWVKPRKSLRGAELLGIDPHGRLYYNSSGYLLVLDSFDAESPSNYYHGHDLNPILNVLKSSCQYSDILKVICKQWDVAVGSNGASNNFESLNSACSETRRKGQIPIVSSPLPTVSSAEICMVKNEAAAGRKPEEKEAAENSCHHDTEVAEPANMSDLVAGTEIPYMSSEGSAETMQMGSVFPNFQKQGFVEVSNQFEIPGKCSTLEDSSLVSNVLDAKQESNRKVASQQASCVINAKSGDASQLQPGSGYMNRYSFAQTASLVVEELIRKPSEKTKCDSFESLEDIIAMQMKVILKKSNRFHWPDIHNLYVDARKENCGWCFPCRYHVDDTDCLFKITSGCVPEVSKSEMVDLQSRWNKNGHVIDVICHIFSIENRLNGLLSGPWLNLQYMKIWHKSILKASSIASVKHLLLALEANLHHLALSTDWMKHVDSAITMGSASHIVIASSRGSAKHGIARTSNPAVGPSICWWRGGRVSRQLFNWKVLPHPLVSKAARQGGGKKILGILYPESSEFSKRSKSVAWRAAVESSTNIEQLAFQVRELDSNIRWDDIENTHALATLDKEFKKSIRLFKKCVVRRKSIEGDVVKYLLDFGKRRIIPDIVKRYGTVVEESSSERKKYWLNESYVPLHLVKSFEERKIARMSNKMISVKSSEISLGAKNSSKNKGFPYLFSKAERSEYYQCGHCNKDVLIREAVCCQYCKGYFHKRHVRKSAGAVIAEFTYTCHRCRDGKSNVNEQKGGNIKKRRKGEANGWKTSAKSARKLPQKGKRANEKSLAVRMSLRLQKDKKVAAAVPLRRSPRKIKYVSLQKKKPGRCKKGKKKTKKKAPKKIKEISLQKKRTRAYHSYWLNGLRLSSKPDDERVLQFQRKMFFAPENMAVTPDPPRCLLCCESGYASSSNYIACEICEEWFHGDAYGLNSEKKSKIIGFRCHVCRMTTPPLCPNTGAKRVDESQLAELQNGVST